MPFGRSVFSWRQRISHPPGGYRTFSFEESELMIPEVERDEDSSAATRQILRATRDAMKIMAGLDTQLHSMTKAIEEEEVEQEEEEEEEDEEAEEQKKEEEETEAEEQEEEEGFIAFQDRLNAVEETIMRWEDQSMIWDSGPHEAFEYVNAADKARELIEKLETLHSSKEDQEYTFLHRAYNILQTAMVRLEEEFRGLLIQNRKPFEFVSSSSSSIEEEYTTDGGSVISSVESLQREEEHILHLTHPDVVPHLKCIANLMFACNYGQECSRAYTIVRRDALDESLFILEMDRLSIDNVLRMQGATLNSKMKRWIWGVKIFVKVYLARERWLCDQIFGEGEPISLVCFVDASKASILQLLDFGVIMSIGPRQPEKLFRILDMYEVLASLMPDIDALYSDDVDSYVRLECHEVLRRLGDCVKATFHEFEHDIASDVSQCAVGGEVHLLTKYVMDYVKALTDYSNNEEDDAILRSPDTNSNTEEDIKSQVSPMAYGFRTVASILECKLDDMSKKFYKDASLQHLFLMNNIHYMAEKVKGLRSIYGDEWIRKCYRKYVQHAMNYERTSFSPILSLLKDDGIQVPGTYSFSKSILSERLRSFNHAFGDLYRVQTGWCVPDAQLREELRISLSTKVIQAYRAFVGRHSSHIRYKDVKYTADDLENYLSDFFEGAAKSLGNG